MVKFFAESTLPVLDFRNCGICSTNIELLTCAIGKNPVAKCSNLKVLNLANNNITRLGAKLLAPALEENKSIEFLDLS
jgi:Ran GTPase-activating protein (RanGAP) involved in mRNA processing and transport